MKLVEINWNPTDRQLRQFGVIWMIALPFIGLLWGASLPVLLVLATIGVGISVLSQVFPRTLKPIFLAMTVVATPIGIVLGEAALLLTYFGVLFPIGLVFRLVRRDALRLKRDSTATTYWEAKEPPRNVASYYRQF